MQLELYDAVNYFKFLTAGFCRKILGCYNVVLKPPHVCQKTYNQGIIYVH